MRMQESIIGQEDVVERLIIGLLANGNLLVEGLPGLAKTRAIKALANNLEADFSRIQFTPDLLPSDVTGTEVYYQKDGQGEFRFEPGPIFANIVLGDEINRAPAKVQAAMLEAMEERQVTVAGTTHKMPPLFMVMATQNPVEQEGTYPLPEAQMDRFLMHVNIEYPPVEDEVLIIELVRREERPLRVLRQHAPRQQPERIPQDAVFERAGRSPRCMFLTPCSATWRTWFMRPARPRNTPKTWRAGSMSAAVHVRRLALDKCGRTHAWLQRRDYVDPEDIRAIVHDCMRHRLMLSYEAQGEGVTADQVIDAVVEHVALP